MIPVSSAQQVRELDRRAIEDLGVSGFALMETASRALAGAVRERVSEGQRIVVIAGAGNNGGDGWGAARWLRTWGLNVAVWPFGEGQGEAAAHRAAAERLGVPLVASADGADWIVDALLGTGLAREVSGRWAQTLDAIASSPARVVAADIPSGLCADTGRVLGTALPAEHTVCFGRLKSGLLLGMGPALCGTIEVVDIGIDGLARPDEHVLEVPEDADVRGCWPYRDDSAHKGSSGHVALLAGSTAMAGAGVLAAQGALRGGAGLVTLVVPRGAISRLGALPPEVMVQVACEGDTLTQLPTGGAWERATALVAGPGLGAGAPLAATLLGQLERLWREETRPALFDADALVATSPTAGLRVLTPHPGEAGRLLGLPTAAVQADRCGAAVQLSERGVALLKGQGTLVAQSGRATVLNPTGGPALATGGSGDVLAGLIGALLARGAAPHEAAWCGAYVHGLAGEALGAEGGWGASDVVAVLPSVLSRLLTPES